jgi:hypothetical protein
LDYDGFGLDRIPVGITKNPAETIGEEFEFI